MAYRTQGTERAKQNAHLKAHGYTWFKITQDWLDDNDDFDTVPGWHLYSPDNRDVTVEQALDEIARGASVVKAEKAEQKRQADERARHITDLRKRIREAADYIRENGEAPKLAEFPSGERILDTSNIMGSGSTFIINDEHIYYVDFYGADGDNWGANNIGGSGRGWRIAFDRGSANSLREMRDELVAAGAHTRLSMFGGTMPATE